MNKFVRFQTIKRMSASEECIWFAYEVKDVLQTEVKGSSQETGYLDVLSLIKLARVTNFATASFELNKPSSGTTIEVIQPARSKVLSSLVYQQLNPTRTLDFFSLFYTSCKRVIYANDSIGSGTVVMAYWPGNGNSLNNINYSMYRIGIIQHFLKRTVKFNDDENNHTYLFCYIIWKQVHPFHDWFGKTVIVASTLNEVVNSRCYMPVQQIAFRCAHGKMSINFGKIHETVLVASPIGIKFCI